MNYRAAAAYTNRSTTEIKEEFKSILEAYEEIGHKQELSIGLLDFWLHGTILVNYHFYLKKLDVEQLLKGNGVPSKHIANILNDDTLDRYVLFKNACLNFIGEELTDDFKTLILDPIAELHIQPHEKNRQYRLKQIDKAHSSIKALMPTIKKTIKELEAIEPYIIAGTPADSILIKLNQMEFLISHQIEE